MKIISKYKDYYDYLVGKYGEDPLVVLDRREYELPFFSTDDIQKIDLYVAGKNIQGLYFHGKFYYGNSIEPFSTKHKDFLWLKYHDGYEYFAIKSKYFGQNIRIRKNIIDSDVNIKTGCPILLKKQFVNNKKDDIKNYYKFPILKELGLAPFIEAEDIWVMISNFLSKKDLVIDNRTNNEKIINAGFDLKESFRGKF